MWARDFRGSTKWIPGVVVQCTGPLTYMIQLDDKSLWKRHVDHLQSRMELQATSSTTSTDSSESSEPFFIPSTSPTELSSSSEETSQSSTEQNTDSPTSQVSAPRRNPSRNRHPPQRFQSEQT